MNKLVVANVRTRSLDSLATVQEFIPAEERSRIYKEEEARLFELDPEGFTEGAVIKAVMLRLEEEYPQAF